MEPHARVWRQALLRFVPCWNLAVQSDRRTALLRHVTRSAYSVYIIMNEPVIDPVQLYSEDIIRDAAGVL